MKNFLNNNIFSTIQEFKLNFLILKNVNFLGVFLDFLKIQLSNL